jgi:ribosomal protein S18 acetylase RimI-like enzyme
MLKLIIENVEQLTDEIVLIPATKEDLDLIIEAELFTTKASYENGKIPSNVKKEIIQDAKDSIEHTRMITYNDEIIGILQAYELEGYWYIGEIYLIEEYRGHGIGRIVLQNEIDNHKDKTLCLNVYKNNTHAIELYKSLGFEVTEDSDGRYIMKLFNEDLTNPKTIEAMKEAKWLSQGNGKKYETLEDLWKDVFEHE